MTIRYSSQHRSRALLLVSAVILYYAAVDLFARHIALTLVSASWFSVVFQAMRLALVLAGLQILSRFWPPPGVVEEWSPHPAYPAQRSQLGWPWDAKAPREFGAGAALGWGMAIVLILPIAIYGGLQIYFDHSTPAWVRLALIVLASALGSALRQSVLCGFPFRRLVNASSATAATLLVALFAVLISFNDMRGSWAGLITVFLFQLICCLAALRTGALWLGFGMDFASRLGVGALFGFPVLGSSQYSAPVLSGSFAPDWLTGGAYGPASSLLAPPVMLIAIFILLRLTRVDVIGNIRPGGIPVDVPPQHAPAYPAAAPPPAGATLVQLGPPQANGSSPPSQTGE